jgi:nucleoside-diphosphate-sugar epimerase
MRIFVAGASGAIGLPLIAELVRRGHTVTGMTSSEAGAKKIIEQGAAAELANAFEAPSIERALRAVLRVRGQHRPIGHRWANGSVVICPFAAYRFG